MTWLTVTEYLCHKSRVVSASWSFPNSSSITGFVTRVTPHVPVVEQVLVTLSEHPDSPPGFSAVHGARSLVFCVVFCRSLFVLFLLAIVMSVDL